MKIARPRRCSWMNPTPVTSSLKVSLHPLHAKRLGLFHTYELAILHKNHPQCKAQNNHLLYVRSLQVGWGALLWAPLI